MNEGLVYEILSVVAEIPEDLIHPCHRVVNRAGRTAPHWPEQQTLLEAEGVAFRANGTVDMARFLWRGE